METFFQYFRGERTAEEQPLLTDIDDGSEPDIPSREPDIPDNTDQTGKLYIYYTVKDEDTLDRLQAMNTSLDEMMPTLGRRGVICRFFNYLFKNQKEKQDLLITQMRMMSPSYSWLNDVQNMQEFCTANPNVEYGDPSEYEDCEELTVDIVKSRNKNAADPVCRLLHTVTWNLKIELPRGWEEYDGIDISRVTSDKGKQALYKLSLIKYQYLIREAVAFRKKHYKHLTTPIVRNSVDVDFYTDFGTLFDSIIEYMRLYYDFTNSLSCSQTKKLKTQYELSGPGPSCNVNFKMHTKSVYSQAPLYADVMTIKTSSQNMSRFDSNVKYY